MDRVGLDWTGLSSTNDDAESTKSVKVLLLILNNPNIGVMEPDPPRHPCGVPRDNTIVQINFQPQSDNLQTMNGCRINVMWR